jgi:hypothetical protein
MKLFLLSGMVLLTVAAVAQQANDTTPISKEKTEFYKNYGEYLIKSKSNKPAASVDSSIYLHQKKQQVKPVVKAELPATEIKGAIVSGKKKSFEIAPGKPQEIEKKVIPQQIEPIKPATDSVRTNQPTNTTPKQVKFIFDSTKSVVAKTTVDSSVYLPKTKAVVKPTIKTDLPGEEITGIIKASKNKSTEILPGKSQPQEKKFEEPPKPVQVNISKQENALPKQVKFIFDSTKSAVAKTTVDSSVYLPKTKTVAKPIVKTDLPAEEITGTIKASKKKSTEILPGKSQPQEKKFEEAPKPVQVSISKREDAPPKQVKFIFDSTKTATAKTTIDSSVYLPKVKQKAPPLVKANVPAQQITGILTPTKKKAFEVAPGITAIAEPTQAIQSTVSNIPFKKFEFKEKPAANNPGVFVDTTKIKTGTEVETVSTDLLSKQIKGTLLPDKKNNLIIPSKPEEKNIEPITKKENKTSTVVANTSAYDFERTTVPIRPTTVDLKQYSGSNYLNMYSLPPVEEKNTSVQTMNDASTYVDPYAKYTVPNAKANYKSQYLTQGAILPKTVVEPLSPDSIYKKFVEDSIRQSYIYDSIKRANEQQQALQNVSQNNQSQQSNATNYYQSYNSSYQNTGYHFYLTSTGHYSVSFSNNSFYLNVDERGTVKDYGLINNGRIFKGLPDGKNMQVMGLNVTYNKTSLVNIAGVEVSYAFDGRINKIGNTYITYNYEGVMEKVGDVNIQYNSNFTVYRFGPFGIAYDINGKVIGVDENRGLIILSR